ncbi:MAG: hypothetical protein CL812_00105 [Confluentimicrobium sp.]|nr:hypothetical protein [Actibacterium sp.]|tara:strand:- start:2531 stop:4033 length:1503 start_codon:yes stop_codon:yes gene_type:complete
MTGRALEEQVDFVAQDAIGGRARRGAAWSSMQIVVRNVLSVAATAIVARILSPEDYGLIGMTATLTALLQVFSEMGLSWATVQRKGLTHTQVSGLFWVNVLAGMLLWGAMAAAAPFLATFYGEPALTMIAIISGATFLVSGAAVQPMALLTRAMAFDKIAIIEVTALIIGSTLAIALAFAGAGYWALVASAPLQAMVRVILSFVWSDIRLRSPRWTPGLGALVSFGGLLALNGVLIYLARNLDSVLVGKVWGAAALGVYNRAYFLMLLPSMIANGVLSKLMVTSLAALQADRDRFAHAYRRALRVVAYVGTPLALGLALTAAPAVEVVYGPGWDGVVALLVWLSLAAVTQPVYNTNGWLFTASGRGGAYLFLTAANTVVLGAVFFWTVSNGMEALARAYGVVMGLLIPLPALWFAHRAASIPYLPSLRALAPVYLLNAIMALGVWSTWLLAEAAGLTQMEAFPIQILIGGIIYLGLTPVILRDMVVKELAPIFSRFKKPT